MASAIDTASLPGWDRKLLRTSSLMTEPFLVAYNALRYRLIAPLDPSKFENCDTHIKEVAVRCFIGLGALSAIAASVWFPLPVLSTILLLAIGSKLCRALGLALRATNYTYVRGNAPEVEFKGEVQILTWNICGGGGGIPIDHGGVPNWKHRFKKICDMIDEAVVDWNKPVILSLNEVYDESLWHALREHYKDRCPHFFGEFHASIWDNPLGAILGSPSGGMVFTNCPFAQFSVIPFTNNNWSLNSAFATLKLSDDLQAIFTHLIYNNETMRVEQLKQLAKAALATPTVIAGDLNVPPDGPGQDTKYLNEIFDYSHQDLNIPTCTNDLMTQWGPRYTHKSCYIDYVAIHKQHLKKLEVQSSLKRAFDLTYNTKTALSDHHAILAKIRVIT